MLRDSYLMIDAVAQSNNVFTRMDARIKVIAVILALAAVIGLPGYRLSAGIFILATGALLSIKVPYRLIAARLLPPMLLGFLFFLMMLFFRGQNELFTLQVFSFTLTGYTEGLNTGITVFSRIAASVSLLLFLSVTTPIQELGYALYWLRVPGVIVEIMMLTYRYIFVLWDEGLRIREAQTLRLGYPSAGSLSGWKRVIRSTGTLMGMVFIRAYDRAESTFTAMQARAYNGNIGSYSYKKWNGLQTQYLLLSIAVLLLLIIVTV